MGGYVSQNIGPSRLGFLNEFADIIAHLNFTDRFYSCMFVMGIFVVSGSSYVKGLWAFSLNGVTQLSPNAATCLDWYSNTRSLPTIMLWFWAWDHCPCNSFQVRNLNPLCANVFQSEHTHIFTFCVITAH